jgi:hypothetical protein
MKELPTTATGDASRSCWKGAQKKKYIYSFKKKIEEKHFDIIMKRSANGRI